MSDLSDQAELDAESSGGEVEDDAFAADDPLPFTYEITSYGADYAVDGLVKRMESGDIVVPDFQRDVVWNKRQRDRFIESLLLGLPVPGIFLARTPEGSRLLVLDGQQRLRTLQAFYSGSFQGKPFTLDDVQERFVGKSYETLDEDDRRRLDDAIIHATVVRQDEPSDDLSSIYFIFERINTGGTTLAPQEIRAALYQGPFNDLLIELNQNSAWRAIYGRRSNRLKDDELILRFLAMRFARSTYFRPMEKFLNEFMAKNRDLAVVTEQQATGAFVPTIELVRTSVGEKAFRLGRPLNAAVYDSVMVGIAERLDKGQVMDETSVLAAYTGLLADDNYVQACSRATADRERVSTRMRLAVAKFASVQ
jgi:hypothetical protein